MTAGSGRRGSMSLGLGVIGVHESLDRGERRFGDLARLLVSSTRLETSGRCTGSYVIWRSASVFAPAMRRVVWSAVALADTLDPCPPVSVPLAARLLPVEDRQPNAGDARDTGGMPFALDVLVHPIVQAPLAGGASTPALAAAVSGAGGLGFLAAGYKSPEAVRGDLEQVRSLVPPGVPFGVNLFAPPGHGAGAADVAAYAATLRAEAERSGTVLGEARWDDDRYAEKLDLVCTERVPVVSFTFGCPSRDDVRRLRDAGAAVWVTVTTPEEARVAHATGVDGLVAQGTEAGGHRGTFDDARPGDLGLLALLQLVRAAVGDATPIVATGGIATGRAVAAVLAAGAAAAQLGTAFMLCPEAATAPAHRAAIEGSHASTALTRAFTGRAARGIINRFLLEHSQTAPSAYPEVHHVTAPLRAAARQRGDADGFHLWAGQTHPLAEAVPAATLVVHLANEAREAIADTTGRLGHPD